MDPRHPRSCLRAPNARCYTSGLSGRPTRIDLGGASIGEVIRRAWSRLVRKQWLILYPLALAIVNTLAFLAVYAADGGMLRWSAFFRADFARAEYVQDHFFAPFSFTPTLAIAVFAGFAACLFAAMIRAPYFRAIAGMSYPLAPRRWEEAANLLLFYLFFFLVTWVVPLTATLEGFAGQLLPMLALVVAILVIFTDYVIVYENLAVLTALRRSVRVLARRWVAVLIIFVFFQLVRWGFQALYELYYRGTGDVFILLPISRVLVDSIVVLLIDLMLIFLYEDTRRSSFG